MARPHQATEILSLEQVIEDYPGTETWIETIVGRVEPFMTRPRPWSVLDVGAAQGRSLVALAKLGHDAHGVEPSPDALRVAGEFAAHSGVTIDIRHGFAESIPFPDGSFDLVIATSVIEHVGDVRATLREVARVLRPEGIFWFSVSSAMSPSSQNEIRRFPGFGWYPDRLKRRIMYWARDNKPELIGHTQWPAINWFTPWKAKALLHEAGFEGVVDRWQLRGATEDTGLRGRAIGTVKQHRLLRYLGEVIVPGSSYAARRSPAGRGPEPRTDTA
jgi:2-polyprenyl-6-hydroxyphenyl methylase/3-demethylubiquinone-9 3-methyltransferase